MMEHCIVCTAQGVRCSVRDMAMRRCPACGFLWLENNILPEGHYGDVDTGLDEGKRLRRRRNVSDRVRTICRSLSLDHTCDVGTGEGLFLKVLQERGYVGCFGIEPGAAGVHHARSLGLDVERGYIGDIASLKKNRVINVITLFHVIEHLDDPRADMRLLWDALPSGGHLVIETPNLRGFSAQIPGEQWELFYPEHLWYFDDRTLPAFVQQFGFRIVAMGKRDFDVAGKSIGELLFRLGMRTPVPADKMSSPSVSSSPRAGVPPSSVFRSIVRRILASMAEGIGRVDYLWIILEKP